MLDTPRYRRPIKNGQFYGREKGPLVRKLEQDILHKGKPLNLEQEFDLDRMCVEIPELVFGTEATKGWAFCHPPVMRWPSIGTKLDDQGEYVMETYFTPFRWECYIRGMKKFGLVCWKNKTVGDWEVPVVPPVRSGIIYQWFDSAAMVYHYRWQWKDQPELGFDPDMRFYVWYTPTVDGTFTSPLMAVLDDWKMAKHASLTTQRITYQDSRQPVFMVHRPPKGKPGDEKFEFEFGDAEELEQSRTRMNQELERGIMSRNANREAVEYSRQLNNRNGAGGGGAGSAILQAAGIPYQEQKPILNSESLLDIEKREGNGTVDRIIYLDPHWEPSTISHAPLQIDSLKYSSRLGQVAGGSVDFPISMIIDDKAKHASNFDAQLTYARDRMKQITISLGIALKMVILDGNPHIFKRMYRNAIDSEVVRRGPDVPMSEEEMMEINVQLKGFVIEQKCTPLTTFEEITQMWEMGVLSHEGFVEQAAHLAGIPEHYLEKEPKKTMMRKREMEMQQADLAKKQFDLSKQTAGQQHELAEKQHTLAEKTAASASAADKATPPKKKKVKASTTVAELEESFADKSQDLGSWVMQ